MDYKNDIQKIIYERRSVHAFRKTPVSREDLDFIIGCGLQAPSARNLQSWFIACVTDQALIGRINALAVEALREKDPFRYEDQDYSVFGHAPAVLFLARDKNVANSFVDCGALAENMALAAQSIGVASCLMTQFMGAFEGAQREPLHMALQMPFGYAVTMAVALGYGDSPRLPKERNHQCVVYIGEE